MNLEKQILKLFQNKDASPYQYLSLEKLKGNRIAVIGDSNEKMFNVMLNLICSEKVLIPIHPSLSEEQKKVLLDTSEADTIIADNVENSLHFDGIENLTISDLYSQSTYNSSDEYFVSVCEEPLIFFTSGTTGKQKAAVITRGGLEKLLDNMTGALRVNSKDILYLPTHVSFIQSFWNALIVLFSGGKVIFRNKINYNTLFYELMVHRCTITVMVPTILNKIVRQHWETVKPLDCLRCIVIGGEIINVNNTVRLLEVLKNTLIANAYGMVETTAVCSLYYGRDCARIGSVGSPIKGVEIIIKKEGKEDSEGEVLVRSDASMKGYFPLKDNYHVEKEKWIETGDIGFYKNGELYIKSRKSLTINKGGTKIDPFTLEKQLLKIEDIKACRISKITDDIFGENFYLEVESSLDNKDSIVKLINDRLPSFYRPKWIDFVTDLKTTSSGKTKR